MTNEPRTRFGAAGRPADVVERPLEGVTERETVGDVVDAAAFTRRLPTGWGVTVDVVQFAGDPLAEALVVERSVEDPRLTLVPAEMSAPTGRVEFYEQWGVDDGRNRVLTADSLSEAVRVAINWVHQQHD